MCRYYALITWLSLLSVTQFILCHGSTDGQGRKQRERDDGARCRSSGICDIHEIERDVVCRHRNRRRENWSSAMFPGLVSRERGEDLGCVTSAVDRARLVKDATRWAWKGYASCAGGEDELRPLTCSGQHWLNLTLTAVDSLDTLLIMGLEDEYLHAMDIISSSLKPHTSGDCNVFETTIRILGGALATYFALDDQGLSTEARATKQALLDLSIDVGSRLHRAFDSQTGLPWSDVNLMTGSVSGAVSLSSLSEMTTLAMEFATVSRLTGDDKFEVAAMNVYRVLDGAVKEYDGLLPQFFNPQTGSGSGGYTMLGARTDSYYEYLLKQWILTGKSDSELKDRYVHAMQSVRKKLLRRTHIVSGGGRDSGLLYASEMQGSSMSPKMDHLVCFLPGLFALGHLYGISTALPKQPANSNQEAWGIKRDNHLWESDLYIAEELAKTCYELYRQSPTGLAPEITHFIGPEAEYPKHHQSDVGGGYFYVNDADAHNILRPETVESLFILWKVTGDPKYRERSWQIFRAFEQWTKVDGLEWCLSKAGDAVLQEVEEIIQKNAWNKIVEMMIDGHKVEDINNETHVLARELLEASRLTDLADVLGNHQAFVDMEKNLRRQIIMLLQGLHSGVLRPGYPRGITNQSSVCREIGSSFGYAGLKSIKTVPPKRIDKMESFWISETLKYLYLTFTEPPDRCLHPSCENMSKTRARYPLTEYVLNTEAHFMPILGPQNDSNIQKAGFNTNLLDPYGLTQVPSPISDDGVGPPAAPDTVLENPQENDDNREPDGDSVTYEDGGIENLVTVHTEL